MLHQQTRAAAAHVCGDAISRRLDMAAAAQARMHEAIVNSIRAGNNEKLPRTAHVDSDEGEADISVAAR